MRSNRTNSPAIPELAEGLPDPSRIEGDAPASPITDAAKVALAEGIADYVETHHRYESMSKREAVIAAVGVLTDDIGAAQRYVSAIGLDLDLYEHPINGCPPNVSYSGVDQTDLADPAKVWRCDVCGATGTSEALRQPSAHIGGGAR